MTIRRYTGWLSLFILTFILQPAWGQSIGAANAPMPDSNYPSTSMPQPPDLASVNNEPAGSGPSLSNDYPTTAPRSSYSSYSKPATGNSYSSGTSTKSSVAIPPSPFIGGATPNISGTETIPPGLPAPSGLATSNMESNPVPSNVYSSLSPFAFNDAWTWMILPEGLLYKSYMAGLREPRIGSQFVSMKDGSHYWDGVVGGRVGLIRWGTNDPMWPEGWQLDLEGSAYPRLDLDHDRDLNSADFRFGVPLTARQGPWQMKFGFYHMSSHMGDEYLVRYNTLNRINYVRDALVLGTGLYLNPNFRIYAEADYAMNADGGAEPWQMQFGVEYSPMDWDRYRGSPFLAVNTRLAQEVDWGGNLCVEAGWQWRGRSGHVFRTGLIYFNGKSDQGQYFNRFEEQIGGGVWYDF